MPTPPAPDATPMRVVVVDDHAMVRAGLEAMLITHPEVQIVAAVGTGEEARRVVVDQKPDVTLVDVNLRGESGIVLCRDLVALHPTGAVVCLTVYDQEQYLFEALRAGARGFLLKRITPEGLVAALRGVLAGEIVVDPLLSGKVAKAVAESSGRGLYWPGMHYGLTKRESEVLQLVCEGFSNREIAEQTFIGEETVKTHIKAIYRKLNVRDRPEVISLALREGLVR
ncbi:MAG: response regulator transcription factor [Acidimicrobiia bacterium]|nr:response regulator transcription factor [Acidimicrobiia bacterium]